MSRHVGCQYASYNTLTYLPVEDEVTNCTVINVSKALPNASNDKLLVHIYGGVLK